MHALQMMQGFLSATAGSILIEGQSVHSGRAGPAGLVGICPQHDLVWPGLTGREHLQFYAGLHALKVCIVACHCRLYVPATASDANMYARDCTGTSSCQVVCHTVCNVKVPTLPVIQLSIVMAPCTIQLSSSMDGICCDGLYSPGLPRRDLMLCLCRALT